MRPRLRVDERDRFSIGLRHLHYMMAAADHGSFRKAGKALGVQESSLSRRIRDLEDQLGTSLFLRHSGGVVLTPAGQHFLSRARNALDQLRHGAKQMGAIGRNESGQLKIGISSSLASGFLRDLFAFYRKKFPGIGIELIEGDPVEHVSAIRQHRIDAAFSAGVSQWPDCESEHLWDERIFVAIPKDHPLADMEQLHWPDMTGRTFIVSDVAPGSEIYDYLLQRTAKFNHHPDVKLQCIGRDNLLSVVPIEQCLALTSEAATALSLPHVVYRPIAGEKLPFGAVWSPRNDNPAWRRLLSLARSWRK